MNMIAYEYIFEHPDTAFQVYTKARILAEKIDYKLGMSESYYWLGYLVHSKGKINQALVYYYKCLKIDIEVGSKDDIATDLNNIGVLYGHLGKIEKELEYYHKSLKLRELEDDLWGIAGSYSNIGMVYSTQKQYKEALSYLTKSLALQSEIKNDYGVANCYHNIGFIYEQLGKERKALEYHQKSLATSRKIKDIKGISKSLNNIGLIHRKLGDEINGLIYLEKGLKNAEELGDVHGITASLNNLAAYHLDAKNLVMAKKLSLRSLELSKNNGLAKVLQNSAKLLSKVYEQEGNGMKAMEMYKLHITMKDSINNETTQKAAAQQQAKYEYEKQKVVDDAQHDKLITIEQEEKEKQQILTIATSIGLGLVVVFLLFIFNRLKITRKQKMVIEEQKQEVELQKEVVEAAHYELEEKNQEIMDSITYAKRIQSAILPPKKVVNKYLKKSFILYKPKDIVAGDFYWLEPFDSAQDDNNLILFAAADCTGHGVPGAMVSVVCNNALNRSVREHGLTKPGEILSKTREIVIQEFEKSEEEVKDGMDIALCSLNGNKLEYAGANNPLWIIRNDEIIETKADKQPIGKFDNLKPYTTHSFELQKDDTIYIFSDGFVDQFGGPKGKKFKPRAFRELLLSIQEKNMQEQKTIIDETFENWKKDTEQVDDVCVIGVRI